MAKSKLSRFNLAMIALSIVMIFTSIVTVTYAAINMQITTSSESVNINGVGTVAASITLTSGNIYLANSSGVKLTTQARLYPAGYFAIPLTVTYTLSGDQDQRPSGRQKMALKTDSGSFAFVSMTVRCGGTGGSTGNSVSISVTEFNKYFTTAQIKNSGGTEIVPGTNNINYYLFLATNTPARADTKNAANFLVNSTSTFQISFTMTAYTVD